MSGLFCRRVFYYKSLSRLRVMEVSLAQPLPTVLNTMDDVSLPQKRFFRQRAHSNPLSDHQLDYPIHPNQMDWKSLFPDYNPIESSKGVEFADIGCGYGGLLIALSSLYPQTLTLGMEIRVKVVDYVKKKIIGLRALANNSKNHNYNNINVLRTNSMKFLPNFFQKAQLSKLFFLFPDPHFKKKKHKARIISPILLSEYAYYLKDNGMIYIATDVLELFEWMTKHLSEHPLYEKIPEVLYKDDPIIYHILNSTEESLKVSRNNGQKYYAIYKKLPLHDVTSS